MTETLEPRVESWRCAECGTDYPSHAAAHACEQRDVIESD